jgi:hypothetical protein
VNQQNRWQESFQVERHRIAEPEWVNNVNAQYALIQFLSEWRTEQVVPKDLAELERMAADRLRIPVDRFRALQKIEDTRELRRALRAVHYRERSPRLEGEDIYPEDGWLGAYLEFAQDSEVPLGWHFWCGVAILGAACRRNLYIDRNAFYITANHYMIMVGPTAAHKSTAIGHALNVLAVMNKELEEEIANTTIDKRVVVLPVKLTPEAMVDALSPERRTMKDGSVRQRVQSIGLLQCAELSVLLGKNVQGADRMIHLATDLYGNDAREYGFRTRKDGEKKLYEPVLSCLFGSTAEWINKSVTSDLFTGGFVGRNMWLPRDTSQKEFPKPPPMDPVIKNQLGEMLLPWARTNTTEVELTPKAEDWFDQWYRENKATPPPIPLMEGWKERKQGHLFKLAMVLAISEMCSPHLEQAELDRCPSIELELRFLERAAKIIDLEQERMPDCFARIGQHEAAELTDEVKAMIREVGRRDPEGWATHSTVFQRVRHRVGTADAFRKIIRTLIEAGEVEVRVEGRSNRYRLTSK